MSRDEIIRMAREARLVPEWLELCTKDEEALERFFALVAAAEREACAKVVEELPCECCWGEGAIEAAGDYAAAIRARGQQ